MGVFHQSRLKLRSDAYQYTVPVPNTNTEHQYGFVFTSILLSSTADMSGFGVCA